MFATLVAVLGFGLAFDIEDLLVRKTQSTLLSQAPKRSLCLGDAFFNMDERAQEIEIIRDGTVTKSKTKEAEKIQKVGFFSNGYSFAVSKTDLFALIRIFNTDRQEIFRMGAEEFYERFPMYKSINYFSVHENVWALSYPLLALSFRLTNDLELGNDRPVVHVINVETGASSLLFRGNLNKSRFPCTVAALSQDGEYFADSCDGRIRLYKTSDPILALAEIPNGVNSGIFRTPIVRFIADSSIAFVHSGNLDLENGTGRSYFRRVDLSGAQSQIKTISFEYTIDNAEDGLYVLMDKYILKASVSFDTNTLVVMTHEGLKVFSFLHGQELFQAPHGFASNAENIGFCSHLDEFFIQSRQGEVFFLSISKAIPKILERLNLPASKEDMEDLYSKVSVEFLTQKEEVLKEFMLAINNLALSKNQGLDDPNYVLRRQAQLALTRQLERALTTHNPVVVDALRQDILRLLEDTDESNAEVRYFMDGMLRRVQQFEHGMKPDAAYIRWLLMSEMIQRLKSH
jgi:hypothetical protein